MEEALRWKSDRDSNIKTFQLRQIIVSEPFKSSCTIRASGRINHSGICLERKYENIKQRLGKDKPVYHHVTISRASRLFGDGRVLLSLDS